MPLILCTEDTVVQKKILDIMRIFRPIQAYAFDYVQSDPGQRKENRVARGGR